jgi:adenylate kinase family enzyme
VTSKGLFLLTLIGPPGCGKKHVRNRIRNHHGIDFDEIEFGEELRQARERNHPMAKVIAEHQDEGKLVPDNVAAEFLSVLLSSCSKPFVILDGFPRNLIQAQTLISNLSIAHGDYIYAMHINRSRERCWGFISESNDRGKRSDDTPEMHRKRYQYYLDNTVPMVQSLNQMGISSYITGDVEDLNDKISDMVRFLHLLRFRKTTSEPFGNSFNAESQDLSGIFGAPAPNFNPGG